jgi:hypothetical protein
MSVSELLRIINQAEQQPDTSITIYFFSIPAPPDDESSVSARQRKPKPKPGLQPTPVPPLTPPAPQRFRIQKLRGGFAIRAGHPEAPLPAQIEIRVAYDVRRGNPLRKYNEADFDVGRPPIRFDAGNAGVRVSSAKGNRMLLAIERPGFDFEVAGFDPERDLYVKADVREGADVD